MKDIGELNNSLWSGHSALVGKVKRSWQDTGYVWSYFGKGIKGRRNYLKFVEQGIPQGRRPAMVGGGLVRSLGGWSAVLGLRARSDRQQSDQRILGDGEFVQGVWEEMDERGKDNLRVNRQKMGLGDLAERVCGVHGVSVKELRAGSRRRGVVRARQDLGVTSSCVTRVASQEERLEDLQVRYKIR